jgi:hypothetical protein
MTEFVDIQPGQWVLAFSEGFEPLEGPLSEHIERFCKRAGGWDHIRASEIFAVHLAEKVMPKTYMAATPLKTTPGASVISRFYRGAVIATGQSREEMIGLRDRFYAIGVEADDRIEAEMYRRIEKFAGRAYDRAEKKIHKLFPHFFGRGV